MTAAHALGRYHVAEPVSLLANRHLHAGGKLKTVDHEPPLAVLDQEDLLAQGIHTSQIVPGAADVDALGSCVFNATTAHLSGVLDDATFRKVTGASGYDDTIAAEKYAIGLYHLTTDLTGDPSSEWPPTDCGSSGLYVCKELEQQGVIKTHKTAVGADNIVSLLQPDGATLLVGAPWFQSWFEPDSRGFLVKDGSQESLLAAIHSGEAGGHETLITAIEKLAWNPDGSVDPTGTVLRVRNSWTANWGDHGSYYTYLSIFTMLGSGYVDIRAMVAA